MNDDVLTGIIEKIGNYLLKEHECSITEASDRRPGLTGHYTVQLNLSYKDSKQQSCKGQLKILNPNAHTETWQHEIEAWNTLAGIPGVPRLIDLNSESGWILYEYVEGEVVARHTKLPYLTLLSIAYQTLMILSKLHKRGKVFGDLHPDNIIFNSRTGVCSLVDFGSCRQIGTEVTACPIREWVLPPEIEFCTRSDYQNPCYWTEKSDIFSWGVVALSLLTGVDDKLFTLPWILEKTFERSIPGIDAQIETVFETLIDSYSPDYTYGQLRFPCSTDIAYLMPCIRDAIKANPEERPSIDDLLMHLGDEMRRFITQRIELLLLPNYPPRLGSSDYKNLLIDTELLPEHEQFTRFIEDIEIPNRNWVSLWNNYLKLITQSKPDSFVPIKCIAEAQGTLIELLTKLNEVSVVCTQHEFINAGVLLTGIMNNKMLAHLNRLEGYMLYLAAMVKIMLPSWRWPLEISLEKAKDFIPENLLKKLALFENAPESVITLALYKFEMEEPACLLPEVKKQD